MGKRNGLSRGDARRNARLIRMRGIVRHDRAILAIDLADTKQVLALCDHDSRVLARRTVRGRAWQLEEALRWGRTAAVEHGFAGVVVGCEPTGHRWRIVAELCDRLELDLVCVQPLLVGRAREQEDLTRDKSDPKDAVLIGRLVAGLRCYLPERTDQVWARLRQLGGRRVQLIIQVGAARQQLRDLLECAWPAHPQPARRGPVCPRGHPRAGPLGRQAPLPADRAGGLGRRDHPPGAGDRGRLAAARRPGTRRPHPGRLAPCPRPARRGRAAHDRRARLPRPHQPGHHHPRPVGGRRRRHPGRDRRAGPLRFGPRAGQARRPVPRANESGAFAGTTRISRRGRPALRLAAWRATWGALAHNPVLAARHAHLTGRDHNQLTTAQARTALAAALLRWLWVVVTTRTPWQAAIAAGQLDPRKEVTAPAA